MRITYIIDALWGEVAGTENQLIKLVNGLGPVHEIELICLRDSPWLHSSASALPCSTHLIEVMGKKGSSLFRAMAALRRHLAQSRPDIVQTFFPIGNTVGVLCARAAGVRHIVSSRRDYGLWMNRRYLLATRFANRFVERIICNSRAVKEITARRERFPENRISVIYNGIAIEAVGGLAPDVALKGQCGIDPSKKVVALIANFRPVKRHSTFIRAAVEIIRQRADVDFLLVGGDATGEPVEAQCRDLARDLGVSSRVHFTRAVGKAIIPHILSFTDVGVNCSQAEGLSNAVMEYMAAEVPCVVSATSGNLDLVQNERTGLTFPVDDCAALARAILRALDDTQARARFVAAALERLRRDMSIEAMLASSLSVYHQLVVADPFVEGETTAGRARP